MCCSLQFAVEALWRPYAGFLKETSISVIEWYVATIVNWWWPHGQSKTWEIKNNSTRIVVNKTSRICSLKFNLSHSRINLTRWTRLPPHSALISPTLFWRCLLNSFPFKQHHIDWLQKSYERWIVVKIIPASTEKPSDLGNLLEQFQMHLFPRPEHQLSETKNRFGGKHSLHADVSYFLRSLRRHLKKRIKQLGGRL